MSKQSRDDAIAAIYAAAAEPDALVRIAYALRSYIDVDSAGLWLIDKGEIGEMTMTADIVESMEPYLNYYRALDPWSAAPKTPGRAFLGAESVDEDTLVRGEFYRDFARHYGMLRPMGVTLTLEPGVTATVSLNRTSTQRLLRDRDRLVLQDLAVHLQGALALRGRILADREVSSARGGALDAVTFGVVVCDADARIRIANKAAAALAESGAIALGGRSRSLAAGTPLESRALQALIRAAAARGQPGAMRVGAKAGAALSILVTPTTHEGTTRALVCLRSDDAPPGVDAATLVRLFGFSPAQAKLCLLLIAGRTFEEAAADRGIATSTARSYFTEILARTGARNLRDVLRLFGSLPQVIASDHPP